MTAGVFVGGGSGAGQWFDDGDFGRGGFGQGSEGFEVQGKEEEQKVREDYPVRFEESIRRDSSKGQRSVRETKGHGDGW